MKQTDEKRIELAMRDLMSRWPKLLVEVDTVSLVFVVACVRGLAHEGDISNPAVVAAKKFFDQVLDVIHRQSPTVADLIRNGEDPAFEVLC